MKTAEAYEADKAAQIAKQREATVVALALALIAIRVVLRVVTIVLRAITIRLRGALAPIRADVTSLADSFHATKEEA